MNAKVTKVKYVPAHDYNDSSLIVNFKGKSINQSVVNAIRRAAITNLPIYAFSRSQITIHKNTSAWTNDVLSLRLSEIPISGVKAGFSYLPSVYWKNVDFDDKKRLRHEKDNNEIEFYLNVTNDTKEKMLVTTNHLQFYINGKKKTMNDKYPSLLIKLKPKQTVSASGHAVLATCELHELYTATKRAYHTYKDDTVDKESGDSHDITLRLESAGQMDEFEILERACEYITIRLKIIKETVANESNRLEISQSKKLIQRLENETNTIGLIIGDQLQDDPDVEKAGIVRKDLLTRNIEFYIESKTKNPLKNFYSAIDKNIKLFNHLKNEIKKLKK